MDISVASLTRLQRFASVPGSAASMLGDFPEHAFHLLMKLWRYVQEQGTGNPGALLQQLQAAQASPRQQALLMRMLQDSVLGAAAREPLAPRVLPALTLPHRVCRVMSACSMPAVICCHTPRSSALLETRSCQAVCIEASYMCYAWSSGPAGDSCTGLTNVHLSIWSVQRQGAAASDAAGQHTLQLDLAGGTRSTAERGACCRMPF